MTITTNTFISRANKKHNNKYNYDKTLYFKYHEKLIITCNIHGDFTQSPAKHLAGQNCPKCAIALQHEHLKYNWTKEEESILIENYQKIGLSLTSNLLNTSPSSVYKKAKILGLTKKVKSKTYHDKISKVTWNSLINGAARRKLEVSITEDDIWDLYLKQNKLCALTGCRINLHKNSKIDASVDRIDSTKGYTKENVQIVLKTINKIKMDLPENDFYKLCKLVYFNLKDKMEPI